MASTSPATAGDEDLGLVEGKMGSVEMLAQSLAGIAPSAVMATYPALIALSAGNSVLYSYIASTIVLLMVGWCITQFAKREGVGTLLDYITKSFGRGAGFIGSVGLAFGYLLIATASLAGVTLYAEPLLTAIGVPSASGMAVTIILDVVIVLLATVAMVQGVELSTRIGLVLEVISVLSILSVLVAVLVDKGFSSAPITPGDFKLDGVTGGMVLAILGYVGFESAACMGSEAKNPSKTIPRAVLLSVVIAGTLYLISSYVQLVGFGGAAKLSADAAPLNTLADRAGVSPLGYLIDVGAIASFFACVTGSINAASRLVYEMAQGRLLPHKAAATHPRHKTPYVAIIALSLIAVVTAVTMTVVGQGPGDILAITGTIGTYGYMLAYLLVTIGVAFYLYRAGQPVVAAAVVGGLAAIAMLYVLWRNVYPVPDAPYNLLPWIFLGVLVVFGIWYAIVRNRRGVDPAIGVTQSGSDPTVR